jgi:alpha-1,3-mannosyltransferase
MDIIHVVRQFTPSVGGLEDVVLNLAKQQVQKGHSVQVFTLDSDFQSGAILERESLIEGIVVKRFPWKGSIRYPVCLIRPNELIGADIIHVHAVDFFVEYFSLLKRLKQISAKLILTTHGGFFHTNKQAKLKQLFFKTVTPFSLSQFDAVTCCGINDYELFKSLNKNTMLIENGVGLQKLGTVTTEPQDKQNIFIYFGRFSENKRLSQLIKLFSLLPPELAKLKIIGRSKTGDIAVLNQLISKNKISNVELITDISDAEVLNHIESAKFTISASEYEGFGLSVVELMSYGLVPLLSQDPPSFQRFVNESGCGRLFDVTSVKFNEIVNDCIFEWSKEKAYDAITYSSRFSWTEVEEKYLDVYR